MLNVADVPLAESALLVIDAQQSFFHGPRWARRSNPRFEQHLTALLSAHRAAGLPVFFFLHNDSDEGFQPGHPLVKLMDFLSPLPHEPVLTKDTRSCFASTGLQARLVEAGVRRLAVTGISMEQCCETTTRAAADLGYAVDFVIDATVTFPIQNWDVPGEELGVEAIAERTAYALRRRFARIVHTARLLEELRQLPRVAA